MIIRARPGLMGTLRTLLVRDKFKRKIAIKLLRKAFELKEPVEVNITLDPLEIKHYIVKGNTKEELFKNPYSHLYSIELHKKTAVLSVTEDYATIVFVPEEHKKQYILSGVGLVDVTHFGKSPFVEGGASVIIAHGERVTVGISDEQQIADKITILSKIMDRFAKEERALWSTVYISSIKPFVIGFAFETRKGRAIIIMEAHPHGKIRFHVDGYDSLPYIKHISYTESGVYDVCKLLEFYGVKHTKRLCSAMFYAMYDVSPIGPLDNRERRKIRSIIVF